MKALLIVDMQKAFFEESALRRVQPEIVAACNQIIAAAQRHRCPIITARTEHAADGSTWTLTMRDDGKGFLLAGQPGAQYVDGLKVADAHEIIKTRDSAFWQTSLLAYLREQKVDSIVLAGVSTQQCVTQTAVDAYNANLRVELADEAIATDQPRLHEPFLDFLDQAYRIPRRKNDEIAWADKTSH